MFLSGFLTSEVWLGHYFSSVLGNARLKCGELGVPHRRSLAAEKSECGPLVGEFVFSSNVTTLKLKTATQHQRTHG